MGPKEKLLCVSVPVCLRAPPRQATVKVAVHPDGRPGSGDLRCLILVEGQSVLEIGCHVYVGGPKMHAVCCRVLEMSF